MNHPLLLKQKEHIACEINRIHLDQKSGLHPRYFQMPIGVQFELTSYCNLYCKHCYNSSGDNNSKDAMNIGEWKKVVNNIIDNGGIFQCIISGGEPLTLGHKLYEIMDPLHDDGASFILITNGMLVKPNTVKKLKKYNYYWIQVSIDDCLKSEHDTFRGVKGSWDKATNAALMISNAGLPLRIAHSVTPDNIDRLPDMISLCYQLGASSVVCGSVMPSGRASVDDSLYSKDSNFLNDLYTKIQCYQEQFQGRMEILSSADFKLDIDRKKNIPNSSIVIRPNGNVRMDCTMPFVIGNVLKNPFSEIWKRHGSTCWSNVDVEKYIANINEFGENPNHRNHYDLDFKIN